MNEQLKIIISAEVDKLKSEVNNAKKSIKDFVKDGTKDLGALNDEFQKYGNAAKVGLGAAAGAVTAAAGALLGLSAATAEYRNEQAKLVTAFETAGASAATATTTYNDLYRVLGDGGQATEAAAHLAKLTTNEKSLSQWTNICKGVYATFGASLPIEGLTEAANETAKVGTVTGTLADALNWAGVSEDAFNEKLAACNTEAEREALIRTTLNGLYNEAATNYEKNNAGVLAQNEAQAQLDATMAKLGETVAPINTMLTELAAEILADLEPYIKDFAENHLPTIKEVLEGVGEKIGTIFTWIADNWEFVSTLGAIILGIAAAISVVSTVMAVVNAVTAASPVTWIVLGIVAAVAALTAAIVLCVKNWDKIKETVTNVVEKIKTAVTNTFNKVRDTITNTINKAKSAVETAINKIKALFDFEFKLPQLKKPSFGITPAGWKVGDLLKGVIPKLSVVWNARGGVFDKPTLFGYGGSLQGIGENGAEAVVPLENNLGWLNKLADMLAERLGNGGAPVVLQVGEKVFGEVAVSSINKITKQTGALPLVIA